MAYYSLIAIWAGLGLFVLGGGWPALVLLSGGFLAGGAAFLAYLLSVLRGG